MMIKLWLQVKRYREAELTHGRVCMLAALGFLAGEQAQGKRLFFNWDDKIGGTLLLRTFLCCSL